MNVDIEFTEDKVRELRQAYNRAVELKSMAFTFEGRVVLVVYAERLLEDLKSSFPNA